jgi:hypothetical protein
MPRPLLTVVETAPYLRQCKGNLSAAQRVEVIDMVAADPKCGELIIGTGGVRKVRFASKTGQGKSGGARVIYFYHNETIPVFLVGVFGKGQRANINDAEKRAFRKSTRNIVQTYGAKK